MTSIVKATEKNAFLLSEIARQSFVESHGNSATKEDIDLYIAQKYQESIFRDELLDSNNIYHIVYYNKIAAGYSKIILNLPYTDSKIQHIAKLERLYLLKEFYDLKLGFELFDFNVNIAKQNHQKGLWLFVWKGNERAVNFYAKKGFSIIGSYDFKISETHSNPNHQMFLEL